MIDKAVVGQRITSALEAAGVSQSELGRALREMGIGKAERQTVNNWANGRNVPEAEALMAIADVLNTTTDYILGRSGDPTRAGIGGKPASPESVQTVNAVERAVRDGVQELKEEFSRVGAVLQGLARAIGRLGGGETHDASTAPTPAASIRRGLDEFDVHPLGNNGPDEQKKDDPA